jgi:hypothetical protein
MRRERGLGGLDVAAEPLGAQRAQQLLLARVAAIERRDADPRMLGHRADRRPRIGDEHRSRRLEDLAVVERGIPASHRQLGGRPLVIHGC